MDSQLVGEYADEMGNVTVSYPGFKQSFSIEELYQHFAERFRRENRAESESVIQHLGSEAITDKKIMDLVEKKDD